MKEKDTSKTTNKPATRRLSLMRDQRGLTTVEYIVLLAFVVVICIGGWKTVGENVKARVEKANTELTP